MKYIILLLLLLVNQSFGQSATLKFNPTSKAIIDPTDIVTFRNVNGFGTGTAVNVKTDYHATGDGTTDDRAAIQAAIDAAGATSPPRTVFLPAGTYKITTSPIEINYAQCTLIGEGINSTIINQATSGQRGIESPKNPNNYITLRGFKLTYNNGSGTTSATGLYLNGDTSAGGTSGAGDDIDNGIFQDIIVTGGWQRAIDVFGVSNSRFINVNPENYTNEGFYIHGNDNSLTFEDCTTGNSTVTAIGFRVSGGTAITIRGGDFGCTANGARCMLVDGAVTALCVQGIHAEATTNVIPFQFTTAGGSATMQDCHIGPYGGSWTQAVLVQNGAEVNIKDAGFSRVRIDWSDVSHACTSDFPIPADMYVSNSFEKTIYLSPAICSSTLASMYVTGAGSAGGVQGAIEWDKSTGATYYTFMRPGNTVALDTFDLYRSSNQNGTSGTVGFHWAQSSNTFTFPGTINAQTALQSNGSPVAVTAANTFTSDQTMGLSKNFVTGADTGSGTSKVGGYMWSGAANSSHNWAEFIDVYALSDWGLYQSTSNGAVPGTGTAANPSVPYWYIDGANNRTSIGHAADTQPSGTKTLNVEGTASVTGILTLGAQVTLKSYTVATLPSGNVGDLAIVTDATLTAITGLGLAPTGGGSNKVPVYYDGAWKLF